MGLLARALFALVEPLLGWASAHPLRTAGGVAAAVAAAVVLSSLGAIGPDGLVLSGITLDRLLAFSSRHPAYPAAVVAGLVALLLWR